MVKNQERRVTKWCQSQDLSYFCLDRATKVAHKRKMSGFRRLHEQHPRFCGLEFEVEVAQVVRAGGLRRGSYRAGFRACRTAIIETLRKTRAARALDSPIIRLKLHHLTIYRLLRWQSSHYQMLPSRKDSAAELSGTSSAKSDSFRVAYR